MMKLVKMTGVGCFVSAIRKNMLVLLAKLMLAFVIYIYKYIHRLTKILEHLQEVSLMYTSYALRETLKNCILVELKYYKLIQHRY